MAKENKQNEQPNAAEVPPAAPVVADDSKCPDCNGLGIKSPIATQVCQTCQGTGKQV